MSCMIASSLLTSMLVVVVCRLELEGVMPFVACPLHFPVVLFSCAYLVRISAHENCDDVMFGS